MGKGSGMTRGDRRRNARRERLRGMLPRDGAVIGIDLGERSRRSRWLIMMCGCWRVRRRG